MFLLIRIMDLPADPGMWMPQYIFLMVVPPTLGQLGSLGRTPVSSDISWPPPISDAGIFGVH